jgi:hypothetical protein
MIDLIQNIDELAGITRQLVRKVAQQYATEVDAILKLRSRDSRRIEKCLDGMLDFCFDDNMLMLYRKLCRYYYNIDPKATASYVHFYQEMWDEQKSESG